MKERIRVLMPEYVIGVLDKDCEHFSMSRENLCNEVLLKISLKSQPPFHKDLIYGKRNYLQFALHKKNRKFYENLLRENKVENESELIRQIFSCYAILPPFLREVYLFREKVEFFRKAISGKTPVKLECDGEIFDCPVRVLEISKESGYLEMDIPAGRRLVSLVRVVE